VPITADSSRILIIQPGTPTDVCRSVPLAAALRRARPEAAIDWLVQPRAAPLIGAHPATAGVISLPHGLGRRGTRVREICRRLRQRGYAVAIDALGGDGSGRFVRASRAPVRIGPACARLLTRLTYSATPPPATGSDAGPAHRVERTLALLEPLGVKPDVDLRLTVSVSDGGWWRDRAAAYGLSLAAQRYAVIAPGAPEPGRRWPIERWTELVGPLLSRGFEYVVMIGRADDCAALQPLRERAAMAKSGRAEPGPLIDLTGETDIGGLMAMIASAGLVVSNDTLPLHIACGLDRPCLGLFGPTDPAMTGPYRRPRAALRRFVPKPSDRVSAMDPKLGDTLMRLISTAAVIRRIDDILAAHDDVGGVDQPRHVPAPVGEGGGS